MINQFNLMRRLTFCMAQSNQTRGQGSRRFQIFKPIGFLYLQRRITQYGLISLQADVK